MLVSGTKKSPSRGRWQWVCCGTLQAYTACYGGTWLYLGQKQGILQFILKYYVPLYPAGLF